MALPAGLMVVPATQRVVETGSKVAQMLWEAGSRPILSSRSVYGPEGLIAQERQFNLTPFGILAGAVSLWIVGGAIAPRTVVAPDGTKDVKLAWVERPRSLLPFAGQSNVGAGSSSYSGQAPATSPVGWLIAGNRAINAALGLPTWPGPLGR